MSSSALPHRPWLDRTVAANDVPVRDNFAQWMGRSKIRHVVFHATTAEFDEFDTSRGDLGAHFGNLDQMQHLESRLGMRGGPMMILPVWLRMERPLRLSDVGSFHADGIAVQLERKGLLRKGEGKAIAKECDVDWRQRKVHDPRLRQIILDAGYDGVVYRNEHEGAGDSWIALDPKQIKSVYNVGLYMRESASLTDHASALALARAQTARAAIEQVQAAARTPRRACL